MLWSGSHFELPLDTILRRGMCLRELSSTLLCQSQPRQGWCSVPEHGSGLVEGDRDSVEGEGSAREPVQVGHLCGGFMESCLVQPSLELVMVLWGSNNLSELESWHRQAPERTDQTLSPQGIGRRPSLLQCQHPLPPSHDLA